MNVQHRFRLHGTCPVDGATDRYVVTVLADRVVTVELILAVALAATVKPIFQEDLTRRIAERLRDVRVRTVCQHGDVRTRCSVRS